jgi:hypothetical protein
MVPATKVNDAQAEHDICTRTLEEMELGTFSAHVSYARSSPGAQMAVLSLILRLLVAAGYGSAPSCWRPYWPAWFL